MEKEYYYKVTNAKSDKDKGLGVESRWYLGYTCNKNGDVIEKMPLKGFLNPMLEGTMYKITGEIESQYNKNYGQQNIFKCKTVEPMTSTDFNSFMKVIKTELAKKSIKGLRSATFEKLFNDAIENDEDPFEYAQKYASETIYFGERIGKFISVVIDESINAINGMSYLNGKGFDSRQAGSILAFHNNDVKKIKMILETVPYQLVIGSKIKHVGFKTVDKIALDNGVSLDNTERISAAIEYILKEAQKNEAHTFLKKRQLYNRLREDLGFFKTMAFEFMEKEKLVYTLEVFKDVIKKSPSMKAKFEEFEKPIRSKIDSVLQEKVINSDIIKKDFYTTDKEGNSKKIEAYFDKKIYYMELYIAERIYEMSQIKSDFSEKELYTFLDEIIAEDKENGDLKQDSNLTDEQKKAVVNCVMLKFGILTGSAGTGKTLTERYILKLMYRIGMKDILVVAPTGKAANRAAEVTGEDAMTIHRALGYKEDGGFLYNIDNPLEFDAIVCDEGSMGDVSIFYNLLKATQENTNFIIIGDPYQLPSVGAGYVLGDIMDSGLNVVNRLTKVFRQGEGSLLDFCDDVRVGTVPKYENPFKKGFSWEKKPQVIGFSFQDIERFNKKRGTKYTYQQIIKNFVSKTVPETYNLKDVQLLSARYAGICGVNDMNDYMQNTFNDSEFRYTMKTGGDKFEFRSGDKVIHIKNNTKLNVPTFNGEVGDLISVEVDGQNVNMSVKYPDGKKHKLVYYNEKTVKELRPAYCITTHKSQGSEYEVIINFLPRSHHFSLDRRLFYTAATRASKVLFFIYDDAVFDNNGTKVKNSMLEHSVLTDKVEKRNTGLCFMLKSKIQ